MRAPDRRPTPLLYALLVALTGGSAIAGFAREALVAKLFGATRVADAYYAALALPFVAAYFLVGGAIAPAVTVGLATRLEAGDRDGARALLGRATGLVTLAGLGLAFVFVLAADPIVTLLSPGFDTEAHTLASRLFVVLVAYGLVTSIALLLGAALTAAGSYRRPVASLLAGNVLSIVAIAALSDRLGVFAAAWGLLAGSVVMLVTHVAGLRSVGLVPTWSGRKTDPAPSGIAWRDSAWLAGALAAAGAIDLAERHFSSRGPAGTIALLALAGKLVHLPMRLVAAPLASVAFPRLVRARSGSRTGSGSPSESGSDEASETASWVVRTLAFCAAVTFIAPLPIVSVAFGRGRFDGAAVANLAAVLAWLAPAIVAVGIVEIGSKYLLAAGLARFALLAQGAALATYLVAAPLLLRFGATGFALARDLSWGVAAVLLVIPLARRERGLDFFRGPMATLVATAAALGAGALALRWMPGGAFVRLGAVATAAAIAFAIPLVRRPLLRK